MPMCLKSTEFTHDTTLSFLTPSWCCRCSTSSIAENYKDRYLEFNLDQHLPRSMQQLDIFFNRLRHHRTANYSGDLWLSRFQCLRLLWTYDPPVAFVCWNRISGTHRRSVEQAALLPAKGWRRRTRITTDGNATPRTKAHGHLMNNINHILI